MPAIVKKPARTAYDAAVDLLAAALDHPEWIEDFCHRGEDAAFDEWYRNAMVQISLREKAGKEESPCGA